MADIQPLSTTLVHRVLPPEGKREAPFPALILLHGRGADEEDLLGLASELDPRLLLLSVRAPYQFSPGGGYTWYDVDAAGRPHPAMFASSFERLTAFVHDALRGYPIDPARVFLLGFSMGTVMAYALALTQPASFRGICATSGYLPEGTGLAFQWNAPALPAFLLTHGVHDPIIPVAMARQARQLLTRPNVALTYREYPAAHHLTAESIADIQAWLTPLLESS